MSQFSLELYVQATIYKHGIHIWRMSDCIVGFTLRLVALFLPFFLYFSVCPYVAFQHCKFVSQFFQELFKLEH